MKNTKANSRVKSQRTLNGVTMLIMVFIACACLGPYANDQITFLQALLNMIKLYGITLLGYVALTFGNYLVRG